LRRPAAELAPSARESLAPSLPDRAAMTSERRPPAATRSAATEHIRGLLYAEREVHEGVADLYFDLHAHPELSGQEQQTASKVASRLRAAGLEVLAGIGGHGVAGLLHNGPGPAIALRGDIDALPVEEKTGLAYRSHVRARTDDGESVGVMHACGHDVHAACLVGAAELLAHHRDRWSGTLLVIAQPAEETLSGARAMLADGLYERTVRPDVLLGQHVMPGPAGALVHRAGTVMAGSRGVRIEIAGRGGHGSQPQLAVDPIVIAAATVGRLQTIVSRELGPYVPAVITVGSFHSGTRPNIIPDKAVLEASIRIFETSVADRVLAAIERIVRAECAAGRSPSEPKIEVTLFAEPLVTDADAVKRVQAVHGGLFGDQVITSPVTTTGSEDFGELAHPADGAPIPAAFWFLGGTAPERWNRLQGSWTDRLGAIPANHSPLYYPDPEPTLRRGVEALASAALAYLEPIAA
jgi:amidohydrolase